MAAANLFTDLVAGAEEFSEVLTRRPKARIERIVSWGQASPPGFWYDQEEGEWVAVLLGRARLRLLEPEELVDLGPGDWLWLAPHRRHRVEWTEPETATVWLAVFVTE
jgi:cupin 2 domain-containing protein